MACKYTTSYKKRNMNEIYCFLADVTLEEASRNLMLMAYVRNPFSRLASGYLEKFVHEWDWKKEAMEYKWLRDRILVNYRLFYVRFTYLLVLINPKDNMTLSNKFTLLIPQIYVGLF